MIIYVLQIALPFRLHTSKYSFHLKQNHTSVFKLNSRPRIHGEVTLYTTKGKIIKRNTIVNLSVLLNLVAYTTSTSSSIETPIMQINNGTAYATYSIQQYENGYVLIFTATFQQPISLISATLYPYSMSLFKQSLASIMYTQEITGVTQIEWAIMYRMILEFYQI